MRRLRGLQALVHDAIDHVTVLVGEGHDSAARNVRRVAALTPLRAPVAAVDELRADLTGAVLGAVRTVNGGARALTSAALDVAEVLTPPPSSLPIALRSDTTGSPAWLADAAIGALNGVVGDALHASANGLAMDLTLRLGDRYLPPEGPALTEALDTPVSGRIAVFVHGLCTTEWSWSFNAGSRLGDPTDGIPRRLQQAHGHTPVFVRYNSGRHVSDNGRLLAERLDALTRSWPVPIEEIVLIGHSMGGLVLRSACAQQPAWLSKVSQAICLGTPHQGAPLEKFGNLASAVLAAIDLPATRIPSRLINARSAGIKDLRWGYLLDEEWLARHPDAPLKDDRVDVDLPEHVAWTFVVGTLHAADHPVSSALGDMLVRVPSASGPRGRPGATVRVVQIDRVPHHDMPANPAVIHAVMSALRENDSPPLC